MTPELKARPRPEPGRAGSNDPAAPTEPVARLRAILFGRERESIRKLERKLEDPEALAPMMPRALSASVRKDPRPLTEALYPVMGPAIRRAIAQALAGMTQKVNQNLEHALSLQGLRWRWEALRTGTSFGEVVLRHSLLYRVEQVLLVHRDSGVLLDHVVAPGAEAKGRDMVAGMLTAIQDFARDSFGVAQEESLETMQVGELTVWVEQGARTLLAAVIRGHAPVHFRTELQRASEAVEAEHGMELADFQGNAAPFARSRHRLEALLQMESKAAARAGTPWRTWALAGILAILLLVLLVPRALRARRWDRYLTRLREEPGIVVTDQGRQDGRYVVRGLRDPLARDPAALLADARLESGDVVGRWEPYVALLPQFVLSRATRTLAPPPTIGLRLVADTLIAAGAAPEPWFRRTAQLGPALAGVGVYREDRIPPRELPLFAATIQGLEGRQIYFPIGRADLDSAAVGTTALLALDLLRLDSLARNTGFGLTVALLGSADDLGTTETNDYLRQARAASVRERLGAVLPADVALTVAPDDSARPPPANEEDRAQRRMVRARVELAAPADSGVTAP